MSGCCIRWSFRCGRGRGGGDRCGCGRNSVPPPGGGGSLRGDDGDDSRGGGSPVPGLEHTPCTGNSQVNNIE